MVMQTLTNPSEKKTVRNTLYIEKLEMSLSICESYELMEIFDCQKYKNLHELAKHFRIR